MQWDESLIIGLSVIDEQHMEFFNRLNALAQACKEGNSNQEVSHAITFLEKYIIEHFRTEEDLMLAFEYPYLEPHKAQHKHFIENFNKIKNQFETKGASSYFILDVQNILIKWLFEHINTIDKSFAKYYFEQEQLQQ